MGVLARRFGDLDLLVVVAATDAAAYVCKSHWALIDVVAQLCPQLPGPAHHLGLAVRDYGSLVVLGFPQLELAMPTSLRLPVQAGHQHLVGVGVGRVFCQQGATQAPCGI